MPSADTRRRLAASLLSAWLAAMPDMSVRAQVAPPDAPAHAGAPTYAQIDQAIARVKADPDLATERPQRVLRWAKSDEPPPGEPGWLAGFVRLLRWIGELFGWFASSARVLVWIAAALLAALLLVFVVRLVRNRSLPRARGRFVAPSHVQDLDIRPESLPDDIGAAAQALWDAHQQRAALALLYRGVLSRLVHGHAVPIRDSSTEGECLELARRQLPQERGEFVARLIGVWQQSVYGGIEPATANVHELCAHFAAALASVPGRGPPP